jgi:hypothetical protein
MLSYLLRERFAKLTFVCTMIGLSFGGGYIVALIAQPQLLKASCEAPESLLNRVDRLEKDYSSRKTVKWSYYDTLVKEGSPKSARSAPALPDQSPRIAERLVKVLGDEAPASIKPAGESNLPLSTGSPFAIQVASLPDMVAAKDLVSRLKAKGYPATLVQAEIAQKGKVFRVRLHGYQSREEANLAAELFEKKEKMDVITVEQ